MNKIGFISLGCPKNQVDSEMMIARLMDNGFIMCDELYDMDIAVINTCGFIEDAKKEAIDNILEMVEMKKDGLIKKVVVTGCLAQRYGEDILREIPEVDAVIGLGGNGDIVEVLNRLCTEETGSTCLLPSVYEMPLEGKRVLTTPSHWAYLKIADGCSNRCTYCAIPSIRGDFRSREEDSIVEEAKRLVEGGVRELILVAQDTTRYGEDLYGEPRLAALLDRLNELESLRWIRLLYCYPDRITDELLDSMARNKKVLHYIDLPLQHANEKILRLMNRRGSKAELLALLEKIRAKLPDAVLRTTMITGFPGEGEEEFCELCDFVKEARFDRLGCFAYSAEEGTAAALLDSQVDEEVKRQRGETIMELQQRIFEEKLKSFIGKTLEVIVDGYDSYTDSYYGRAWTDAPDIDSVIHLTCGYELNDGDIVTVEVTGMLDFDLIGEVC